MDWLAYMVQHPSRAAEVALCFKGEKGTGKGTLGRAAASLAGSHGLHISSPEHLVGRFNSHLQNCICLFADEAFWAGDKAGEAKLKQLVTEPTIAYEGKGRDAVMGKNHVHIIMAANGDWVVPAGLDGERRFAVFQVSSKKRGDKAFFTALNKQLYREGGIEAMLHDLLLRDIEGWAPRDDVPATSALVDQKVLTMDDVERWWYNKLLEGMMPNGRGDWHEGGVTVIKEHLRSDYLEFAKEQRVYRPADPVSFGMRLNKLLNGEMANTQVKPDDSDYAVKVDRAGRASASKMPRLSRCREMMEGRLGSKVDWPRDAFD
jgi:phage/plasmid-associated DNA primase